MSQDQSSGCPKPCLIYPELPILMTVHPSQHSWNVTNQLRQVAEKLQEGRTLAEVLGSVGCLDPHTIQVLHVSESHDILRPSMKYLIEFYEALQAINRTLRGLLSYGFITLLIATIIYSLSIIHIYNEMHNFLTAPGEISTARSSINYDNILNWHYHLGLLLVVAVVMILLGLERYSRIILTKHGIPRSWWGPFALFSGLWLPGVNKLIGVLDSRFCVHILEKLIDKSLPLVDAINEVARVTANPQCAHALKIVSERLLQGTQATNLEPVKSADQLMANALVIMNTHPHPQFVLSRLSDYLQKIYLHQLHLVLYIKMPIYIVGLVGAIILSYAVIIFSCIRLFWSLILHSG